MPVTSYSRTPASNNAAPPNGAPEGWAPGSMNNTVRQIMTDIVNEAGKNAAKVLGTVAGTNTITAVMSPTLDVYAAGMIVVFTPAATNTGAVTINIDTLGALDIQKSNNIALAAGDLVVGVPALLVLDSGADDFILMNPQSSQASGTFTGTLTGYASPPTGTVNYLIQGKLCTLYLDTQIGGTANTTGMTMTGLPTAVRPATTREVPSVGFRNNNLDNSYIGSASITSAGVITFKLYDSSSTLLSSSVFINATGKGLTANWSITYPLF